MTTSSSQREDDDKSRGAELLAGPGEDEELHLLSVDGFMVKWYMYTRNRLSYVIDQVICLEQVSQGLHVCTSTAACVCQLLAISLDTIEYIS
jgi:hypothetical protein